MAKQTGLERVLVLQGSWSRGLEAPLLAMLAMHHARSLSSRQVPLVAKAAGSGSAGRLEWGAGSITACNVGWVHQVRGMGSGQQAGTKYGKSCGAGKGF